MNRRLRIAVVVMLAVGAVLPTAGGAVYAEGSGQPLSAKDWPTWRGVASRSAASSAALPRVMQLRWVRKDRTPAPAWPETQDKLRFDTSFEPVAAGHRLFVPSMVADRVTAYDTRTGDELWRFYTDGPVRFAPLVWKDDVYVASDDGFLYCLTASDGTMKWKVRGGPDGRMVLGNGRLISAWPARGAPVLWESPDGQATLYFAAGIWPFMGTFLRAVDAETGRIVWTNSGSGSIYVHQQHNSPAFAGVAPQGYLAATDALLLVAGGRTVPAVYDRKTGEFLYFHVADRTFGKDAGGYDVGVMGDCFFNNGCLYRLADGKPLVNLRDGKTFPGVLDARLVGGALIAVTEKGLDVYGAPQRIEEVVKDNRGKKTTRVRWRLPRKRHVPAAWPMKRVFFQAGGRVFGAGDDGHIGAIDLAGSSSAAKAWTARVDGDVWTMFPADDRLFVVTVDGAIACFAEPAPAAVVVHQAEEPGDPAEPGHVAPRGYAMRFGLDDRAADRLAELARDYHVIGVDPDARRVADLRRRLDDAGLYGTRVHLLAGDPHQMRFPPYLAGRIEFGGAPAGPDQGKAFVEKVFDCLRPYGGTAVCVGPAQARAAVRQAAESAALPGAVIAATEAGLELRREGPLPRSAPWTHQYADVANTVTSQDDRVKPPLGLLWFGGPSHADILPRHGHGPSPQVVGGRLFIEGPHALRAVDVYTGRLLWQRELPDLGKFYDNTDHQPGAGEIGGNYVSLADGIYVVHDRKCLRLDPATGETVREFALPAAAGRPAPHWGYIGVYEDLLIAGSAPLAIVPGKKNQPPTVTPNARYASSSQELVVMDRHTGRVLWTRRADQVFRHNAIVAGAGKIFCIDAISEVHRDLLARRGRSPDKPPVLLALDARTGRVVWRVDEGVFGTWLGYSAEHDLLLQAGSPARDRAEDEARSGMAAYRGRDGYRLWRENLSYTGTPILNGSAIYTDGKAFALLTGKPLQRTNPLTGRLVEWRWERNYGCNTPIAGRHMLLFRSAAAGFYDLQADAGTGNWGGFKSGCTANLIPADGVLNAPDYTRTCTCSYQNQCSLALVPMPDVEVWTFQAHDRVQGPLKRVGVNFGAPGDWLAPDGTLWLDEPAVGGQGPDLGVTVDGAVRWFRRHALEVRGPAPQVTASGLEGVAAIRLPMKGDTDRPCTVRLYFCEPTATAARRRLFDVAVQGKPAVKNLDVWTEAGGYMKGLTKTLEHVPVGDALTVELRPAAASSLPPILCGIEAVME